MEEPHIQAAGGGDPAAATSCLWPTQLLDLSNDILTTILVNVANVRDIAAVSQACRRLRDCSFTGPWQRLCEMNWGSATDPSAWLAAAIALHDPNEVHLHAGCSSQVPERAPTSFRALYRLLASQQHLVGYWRGVGDAPRGSLFRLSWAQDCLELHQLQCSDTNDALRLSLVLRLGPSYPLNAADLLGETHLVVRQYRGQSRTPCAAANAAAAVSAGGPCLPRRCVPVATSSSPSRGSRSKRSLGGEQDGSSSMAAVLIREDAHPGRASEVASASGLALAAQLPQAHMMQFREPGPSSSRSLQQHQETEVAGSASFSGEVLKFMATQVAPPRGSARRQQRLAAKAAARALSEASAEQPMAWAAASHPSTPVARSAPLTGLLSAVAASHVRSHSLQLPTSSSTSFGISMSEPSTAPATSTAPPGPTLCAATPPLSPLALHGPGGHVVPPASLGDAAQAANLPLMQPPATAAPPGGLQPLLPPPVDLGEPMDIDLPAVLSTHQAADAPGTLPLDIRPAWQPAALTRPGTAGSRPASSGAMVQYRPVMVPAGPPVHTHHFVRMECPQATRAHPLAGLWKGVYGPHGLEIVSVGYDFSGPQARVCAWKATGDHNVPAGQDTWWASAAPQLLPWTEHELRLQEARLWLTDLAPAQPVWLEGNAGAAGGAGAAAGGAGAPPPPPPHPPGQAGQAGQAGAIAELRPKLSRILSSHVGFGRIAGHNYSNPQWVPGRLWVYEDGNIAFLYMWPGSEEEPMFLVDYSRVPGS